jgi:hypothetical protein
LEIGYDPARKKTRRTLTGSITVVNSNIIDDTDTATTKGGTASTSTGFNVNVNTGS